MASATVLWIPFIYTMVEPYSSKSNLQQYTQSEVRPRASCIRFLWFVYTVMVCPQSMPLNSLSVSTMVVLVQSPYISAVLDLTFYLRMPAACSVELSQLLAVAWNCLCISQILENNQDRPK